MEFFIGYLVIAISVFGCNGVTFREQLEHVAKRRRESQGTYGDYEVQSRRYNFNPGELSTILGAPSMPSHLPEAEPIMPGHTLIRPALGMLKSAVKFPHKELENGAGVYGNSDNLGIKYDGKNERLMYSGFRRTPSDYIVVLPLKFTKPKPKALFPPMTMDLVETENKNLRNKKKLKHNQKRLLTIYSAKPKNSVTTENKNDLDFIYKILEIDQISDKVASLRREDESQTRLKPGLQSSSEEQRFVNLEYNKETSNDDTEEDNAKLDWFWKSKNAYNHLKLNSEAPNYTELLPANTTQDLRSWWFYHQEDYEPFNEYLLVY